MADLTEQQSSQAVKITGANTSGVEDNYMEVDANNNAKVIQTSAGPVTPGTVATNSELVGGQFNTSLPTLSNTQQSAIQLDSSGRQIIAPLTNTSVVKSQLQDNAGTAITVGQKVMASSVPVVLASDQSSIPVVAAYSDVAPANQTITALDTGTTTFVGANSQNFYTGSTTANSTALYALSSIGMVNIQANILGGGGTLVVEVSSDGGTFWLRPSVFQPSTQSYSNAFTAPFVGILNVSGMTHVRVRSLTSWSGTATIIIKESLNSHAITIVDSLPTGTNSIGTVKAQLQDNAGTAITLGQKVAASSVPVILASDQTLPLPSGAATSANQSTEITSLQILDDVPSAMNAAFSKGAPAMGQLDDTSTIAATEDNVAPFRITPQRALHVNFRNQAGTELGSTTSPVGVKITDGTDTAAVSTANGEQKVVDGLRNGGVYGTLSIPTANTAVQAKVGASVLANRKFLQITIQSTNIVYGFDSSVTFASGCPTSNGQVIQFSIDPDSTFQIWLVSNANAKSAHILESP